MNVLTLRSPADVIAAVPYLLGFHPTDSIVLIGLRGKRVIFQARTDAPLPAEIAGLAGYLAAVAIRQCPSAVILVGYGPAPLVCAALDALRAAVMSAGVPVPDVLRVHEGRYWSLECADPACCPVDGTPFDPSVTSIAAAATYEGLVALPDRRALVDGLSPLPGPGIEPEIGRALDRLSDVTGGGVRRRRAAARSAVRQGLDRYAAGGRLDDDEVAWLAVLLTDTRSRDEAWQRMLATAVRDEHETLWRDLVRRLPDRYVAAPATLLALAAWRAGDGALACVAVDRALAAVPGYALAELVLQALNAGIPPSAVEGLPGPAGRRGRRGPRLKAGAG